MGHDAVNNELRNVFRWNYAGIARANYIMEYRNKIDFDGKDQIIAQTQFLRAFYYFQLVKYFGDVPLIIDRRLGAEEVTTVDRTPRAEVYAQIEADLQAAAAVLPWNNPVKGRVEKGAALALLGKVHLYQKEYQLAANALDRVINEGGFSLLPDYQNLWYEAFEDNSETVFDIEYSNLEGGGYGCIICLEGNAAPGFHGIRQYEGPIYGDGNSYNLPTADLYNFFDNNDPRKDITVLDIEAFKAAQTDPSSVSYATGAGGHTGYYNNKYIKRKSELGLPDDDLTSPLNYKVIRYADVLLMAAEAHAQLGAEQQARDLVNLVRNRVGMGDIMSSGTQLLDDIYRERRLELSGEGHRFFDLVRTGRAAAEIDNFVAGKHELFPIPQEPTIGNAPTQADAAFTFQATAASDNIIEFTANNPSLDASWDFGNGSTAKGSKVQAAYPFAGTYTVTLTVQNSGGSASSSQDVTIANDDPSLIDNPLFGLLTGGSEKTWAIDSVGDAHFGVGPDPVGAAGNYPEWYAAKSLEKSGSGMYDDRYTFKLSGFGFDMVTNGDVYVNTEHAGIAPFDDTTASNV
ncbi:unnamed protein product, partial [Symbiodinium sp. CCMP2456]